MNKWVARGLIAGGMLYILAMIPANIRPSWSAAPFRKPDQTINVDAVTQQGTLPADIKSRVKHACLAATPLRPIMGSAKHVRVVVNWNGKPMDVRELECELYTS